jgi:ATP-dependent helicase/nuclease subunit A
MTSAETPNDAQRELIDTTDGVVRVDAGAGTGKTFAVTRRYAEILGQPDVTPEDILLVTFTNNAATEMRDRIIRQCDAEPRDLKEAPIQTFHSFCHHLLLEHGYRAPAYLGYDHGITQATSIVEDETIERQRFLEFYGRFRDDHPEHEDFYRTLDEPEGLLGLVKGLASKGVFPSEGGWYRNGRQHLMGDRAAFEDLFAERNRPRNGGSKQSELRKELNGYGKNKTYRAAAPEKEEIRGSGTKQVPPSLADRVWEQDRSELLAFVHDLYREYLGFTLRRNELNFGFLQGLAYVLLCEDHDLREEVAFDYVMIDEFQDTSEIQFQLGLLLSGTDNLCVVGDWKQSIYSFQYADVENITRFRERLGRFKAALNEDHDRLDVSTDAVQDIELTTNYRSTQRILDFAEESLFVPATKGEGDDVDAGDASVVSLEAETDRAHSRIEAFQHEDEPEAILTKIQRIVDNDDYQVEGEDGELRAPTHDDITVLTRTRDFGRELLNTADEYEIPLAYEGEVQLLRSDQAKLLLAWLRILDGDQDEGWAVVLERAGYTLEEIEAILDPERVDHWYPEEMEKFRDRLADLDSVGGIAEQVFQRYGYDGEYADQLLHTIQSVFDATTMSRGDLIRYIEQGVDAGATHEVHTSTGEDSVLVQTIHATKGLEHPIVILANMNRHRFPPSSGGSGTAIRYQDPIGLRQAKEYAEDHCEPYVYDDWQYDVLRRTLPTEYDEERRLLYVAITRAEHHVLFSAGDTPNQLLEELSVEIEMLEPDVAEGGPPDTVQAHLQITVPEAQGPRGTTPHALMDEDRYGEESEGLGKEFGSQVHDFAEDYGHDRSVQIPESEEPDFDHVAEFIDGLSGKLHFEQPAYLPLTVDGEAVTVSGVVDLVHVTAESVDVIDYKTDRGRHAEENYRTQLSVYHHVIMEAFPDRTVRSKILYTGTGDLIEIDPFDVDDIREQYDEFAS